MTLAMPPFRYRACVAGLLAPLWIAGAGATLTAVIWARRDPTLLVRNSPTWPAQLPLTLRWSVRSRVAPEDLRVVPASDGRHVMLVASVKPGSLAGRAVDRVRRAHPDSSQESSWLDRLIELRDTQSGRVRWRRWISTVESFGAVALDSRHVYVSVNHQLLAFHRETGRPAWRRSTKTEFYHLDIAEPLVLARTPERSELWTLRGEFLGDDPTWARDPEPVRSAFDGGFTLRFTAQPVRGPAGVPLGIDIRNDTLVPCDPRTPTPPFIRKATQHILGSRISALAKYTRSVDRWYVLTQGGTLHAFDEEGRCRWERSGFGEGSLSGHADIESDGPVVLVLAKDTSRSYHRRVDALDAATGGARWGRTVHEVRAGSGWVLAAMTDALTLALRTEDGREIWRDPQVGRNRRIPPGYLQASGSGFLHSTQNTVCYVNVR